MTSQYTEHDRGVGQGIAPDRSDEARAPGSPYVPARRDERGQPVAAVPHEHFLATLGTTILLVQSAVLAVVGVWGLVLSVTSSGESVSVLGLGLNVPHAILLLLTAVLAAASGVRRRWLRRWAVTQAVVWFLVFAFGSAMSVNTVDHSGLALNGPDHLLHAVLAILPVAVAMMASARMLEPPPGPLAYPTGRTDDPDSERDHQ